MSDRLIVEIQIAAPADDSSIRLEREAVEPSGGDRIDHQAGRRTGLVLDFAKIIDVRSPADHDGGSGWK